MDAEVLGETNTNALYNLTDSLGLFHSANVYTVYDWLVQIYQGKKEPSRNEFDQDFNAFLLEEKRTGNITEEQMQQYKNDRRQKVQFEIRNMFTSGNRVTYGRVTTFCPVLMEEDFINTVEKMAVTAEKIADAINKVRCVDYSALYHDVMFSDPDRGINQEWIKKEILPDVILMPNAGTRTLMWQETSGAKIDTPARFLFPIFPQWISMIRWWNVSADTAGRSADVCRVYTGTISGRNRLRRSTVILFSIIANSDLSADAKEKIKTALSRARNSYREVFVKDYQAWMKYESQGSFRLNKVARDILVRYCPFAKDIRQGLATNPQYQNAFHRLDAENRKKLQRFRSVYDKYEAAGGEITPDLKENLRFYQM